MVRRYTIDSVQLAKQQTRCTLICTAAGREGAMKYGGWEDGSEGGNKGGIEGREGVSDDARQGESVSGGREGDE